jgi:RNA polymerase sigma factor (sigma-70 family)
MKLSKKKGFRERNTAPCGERSPYWQWLEQHARNDEGDIQEPREGNPDVLAEQAHLFGDKFNETEHEKLEAIYHAWNFLSEREKEVLMLYAYEGKTGEEMAEMLQVSESSIRVYLKRISLKVKNIYRQMQH